MANLIKGKSSSKNVGPLARSVTGGKRSGVGPLAQSVTSGGKSYGSKYTYSSGSGSHSLGSGGGGGGSSRNILTGGTSQTVGPLAEDVTKGIKEEKVVKVEKAAEPKTVAIQRAKTPQGDYASDIVSSVAGEAGSERRARQIIPGQKIPATGKGGVFERVNTTFFGLQRSGAEFGQRVGGTPGRVVGTFAGSALGGVGGIFEATFGTGREIARKTITRGTGSELAGQTAGLAIDVGSIFIGGGLAKGAAKEAPQALRGLSSIVSSGRSIYAAPTKLEKAATALETAGKVARPYIQNPFVNIPARTALAFGGVEAGRAVSQAGESKTYQTFTSSSQGQEKIQRAYAGLEQEQRKNILSQIGGSVGFGALDERYSEFGGLSKTKVESTFRKAGVPENLIPAATREYRASQIGSLVGQISLGSTTETVGRYTIGGTVTRELAGQVVGGGAKGVTKKAAYITAKTVPAFAALGFYEGVGSTVISEQAASRIRGVQNIPGSIAQKPVDYLFAGVFGAASSITLGAPVVGFATKRALQAGGIGAKAGEKGFLYAGYGVDPTELPGDIFASQFGPPEPSFRIRAISPNVTPVSQQTAQFAPTSVLQPVATPVQSPTGILVPNITDIFQPSTPRGPSTPSSIAINFRSGTQVPVVTDQPIQDSSIQTSFNQNISTPVPIPISLAIPIAVPNSRAPFPLLFPPGRLGGGGRGGGRKARIGYFDELAAVFGSTLNAPLNLSLQRGRPARSVKARRKNVKTLQKKQISKFLGYPNMFPKVRPPNFRGLLFK